MRRFLANLSGNEQDLFRAMSWLIWIVLLKRIQRNTDLLLTTFFCLQQHSSKKVKHGNK